MFMHLENGYAAFTQTLEHAMKFLNRSLAGVMASMGLVNLVYGISFPLLALVLDQQGVSKTLIALNTATQALAIFAIAPLAPGLMARFSHARIMQLSALALAFLFLLIGCYQNIWFWFPLRFLIGALTALLWITSEALINAISEDHHRGRVVAIYSAVGSAGFALGPLLLIGTGSSGILPFLVTVALILLAAMPLWWVTAVAQQEAERRHVGLWVVVRAAPVIMLANLVYAASVEAQITFFPLFGMSLGLSEAYSLSLMTLIAFGGMVLIIPLGWLADHVDRMGLMAICVFGCSLGFFLLPWMLVLGQLEAGVFVFFFGGVEGMIYALGVTLIGERFKGAELASATTAFTVCWGAGTILGPLLAGIGMDLMGDRMLAWIAAGFFLCYLPLPLASWWRRQKSR